MQNIESRAISVVFGQLEGEACPRKHPESYSHRLTGSSTLQAQ